MIDNMTNTSKGVEQAVGGSLATALRDRQAYVIPIQPNRSLPVRPAPHHTPSRASIVKTCLGRSSTSFVTSIHSQALVIDVPSAIQSSNPLPSEVEPEKTPEKVKDKVSTMKKSLNIDNVVTTSDNFIDISRSPERIDLSEEICPSKLDSSSPGCWVHGSIISREKRKRRRKGKKTIEDNNYHGNPEAEKTVPPLRLKKIQTLQQPKIASGDSTWQENTREINGSSLNVESGFVRAGEYVEFATGMNNKYRIVTGHSPPYEESIDSSKQSQIDGLDIAKLRYRQTKLKLKLRELRRKTLELGNEMLRTVLTNSTGTKGSRLRQTMTRYEGQIKHLEQMIDELPKVGYVDDNVQIDWNNSREVESEKFQNNCEENVIISPARTICSSNSSSLCSSPSLEPPKLSPRSPTNYAAAKSPSDVRNSPPVLPRIYVTIADCDDERDVRHCRRGRVKRRNRSPLVKPLESIAGPSSPVITTTGETIVSEKVELDVEEDNYSEKLIFDQGKSDFEIVEIYDEPKFSENFDSKEKILIESLEDVKPVIKRFNSPETVVINTTSVDNGYENKSQVLREINGGNVNKVVFNTENISSSCGVGVNVPESKSEKEDVNKEEIVTVREDDVPTDNNNAGNSVGIDQQFPTLGNWIARLSKKQVNTVETSNKLPDAERVDQRPSAFQMFSTEGDKSVTPEAPRAVATRPVVEETVNVAPQWKADRWREQQGQQPQTLPQSYAPTLPLPPPPAPPSLSQEFCSPIAMARLYARNYAIDPYSVAYGYNPAIAAAAATASLWNSAAILQYPLMRPSSSLLNSQQARIPSGTVQFPANAQPLQRPNYRVSIMQQNAVNRAENSINYSRDGKILPSGYPTSFEQAKRAIEYRNAVAVTGQNRGISYNSINGQTINYRNCLQQQRQTTEQQQQFVRANCSDNSMRLPVPGSNWRTGHVLGPMANDYNYGTASPWNSTASGNILNSIVRGTTPGFVSSSAIAINSSRARNSKDSNDSIMRNCETPHLGKVNYSPNTVNNLACSNCGLAGSMFKCLGCEIAFYCDENCQARHWNRHVISCPKKMPKLKKLGR